MTMADWLNYHHLLYFWAVAKHGSVARASSELRLAQPTLSGQIRLLEQMLGEKLFQRRGRNLVLTDVGRVAFDYANEIFSLGTELVRSVKERRGGPALRVAVGVSNVFPKSFVRRILEPVFALGEQVRVVCKESPSPATFLADFAAQRIDVVLADRRAPSSQVRLFSHLLGECGTAFLASPALAKALRRNFPRSLDRAPFLLPGDESTLRQSLEQWLDKRRVYPSATSELDDSALATVLGEAGFGVFAVPDVVADELVKNHDLALVGRASDVRQSFYAISSERRIKHPAVVAICETVRQAMFA